MLHAQRRIRASLRFLLALVPAVFMLPGGAFAAVPQPAASIWTTTGPYGGETLSLAGTDKGILYAGAREGVFVSRDWGETWMPRDRGIAGLAAQDLCVDRDGDAFAATGQGLFKKAANNWSWRRVGPADFYYCVAVDPSGAIYAGTYNSGLLVSLDRGETWNHHPLGSGSPIIYRIVVDDVGDVYAGTQQGVYVSRDSGASWQQQQLGSAAGTVTALALAPSPTGTDVIVAPPAVYAGTRYGEVYSSTDRGESWRRLSNVYLPSAVTGIAVLADGTVWAANGQGVWSLAPGQTGWSRTASGYAGGSVNGMLSIAGHLFLATGSGVEERVGPVWTEKNQGIWAQSDRAIAAGPNGLVVVAAESGIFRSQDAGATWSYAGEPEAQITSFAVGPGPILYAATLTTGRPNGILRSKDSGLSWQVADVGLPTDNVYNLAVSSGGVVFAATQSGLYRSDDGGDHWTESDVGMAQESLRGLAIAPDGSVFACSRNGIFRSVDHGQTWTAVNTGLISSHAEALAVSTTGAIYAGSGPRVYRSMDDGKSWQLRSDAPGKSPGPLQLAAGSGNTIYAADLQTGVWMSTDGAAHWQPLSNGLYNPHVLSIALTSDHRLLAGTNGSSVWQWRDEG